MANRAPPPAPFAQMGTWWGVLSLQAESETDPVPIEALRTEEAWTTVLGA